MCGCDRVPSTTGAGSALPTWFPQKKEWISIELRRGMRLSAW